MGNPRPLFLLRGLAWDGRGKSVGARGLRLSFEGGDRRLEAVGWSLAAIPPAERRGRWDVLANVAHDSFLGRPGLTVLDAVRAEAA